MFAFVTLVAWAYNKVVLQGDSSLTVPLIKAEEGAIKVPPQNPGGLEVPHQDSSIYNSLDGRDESDEDVQFTDSADMHDEDDADAPLLKKGFILEQGKLAEDKPLEAESLFGDSREGAIARARQNIERQKPFISDNDIRDMEELEEQNLERVAPEEVDAGIIIETGQSGPDLIKAPKPAKNPRRNVAQDVAVSSSAAVETQSETVTEDEGEKPKNFSDVLQSLQQDMAQEDIAKGSDLNLESFDEIHTAALLPKPRNNSFVTTQRGEAVEIVLKNSYVQLASLPNESDAQKEWAILQQRYGDVLGALPVRYKTVDLEGRGRYTRIQAGPLSEEEARGTCAALQAAGKQSGCIVVSD